MFFRNGQWVLFHSSGFPGAFRSRDGRVVGIFCYPQKSWLDGKRMPPHIAVVDKNGENLQIDVGGAAADAGVSVNQPGLEPVMNRNDIPPARIAHLPKDWQPSP